MSLAVDAWYETIQDRTGLWAVLIQHPISSSKATQVITSFLSQLLRLVHEIMEGSLSEGDASKVYRKLKGELETGVHTLRELSLDQRGILIRNVYQIVYDDVNSHIPFRLIGDEGKGDVEVLIC